MEKTILIVDDDPDIHQALEPFLRSHGFYVLSACDGIEALASLRAHRPDLMILDLLMPRMSGFGVLKELRSPKWADFRDMPILILTAVREESSRRRYKLETETEFLVDGYMEKPFTPDVLLDRIENLIAKRQKV